MKTFVDQKIEEIYNVAINLGLDKATRIEKNLFRKALKQIAVAAVDEMRSDIGQVLNDISNKYSN